MKNRGSKTCFDGLALDLLCLGSPEPIERNPFNCVPLTSVSELNRTQSDGLSSIEFDLFDWIRFVRKSNSLKVWCSISLDCRTQSNSIHGLSSIDFDLLCRVIKDHKQWINYILFYRDKWLLTCALYEVKEKIKKEKKACTKFSAEKVKFMYISYIFFP